MSDPAIILISTEHADVLEQQFSRYARDYDVRVCRSLEESFQTAKELAERTCPIALFVVDTALPEGQVFQVIKKTRTYMPSARRVVVSAWERFRDDVQEYGHGQATGKFDAFLMLPRGRRDEEFHSAVIDLLNDWNATVGTPVVDSFRIVAPERSGLALEVKEYADRVGVPCRIHHPDSDVGQQLVGMAEEAGIHVLAPVYFGTRHVNLAPEEKRASYTAVANTTVGVALLGGGAFGVLASMTGPGVVLGVFAGVALAGAGLAWRMKEV